MSTKRFAALFMALAMVFTLMAPAFAFADGELPEEAPGDLCLNGHTPGSAVQENNVDPTCTEAGYCDSVVYCETCRAELSRDQVTTDPALGHDIQGHEGQAATCTEAGWEAYETCSRCDYTTYTEIPANGHIQGAAVEENSNPATCTEAGSYDLVVYCTECGAELSRETIPVDANGHDFKDGVCTACGAADPEPPAPVEQFYALTFTVTPKEAEVKVYTWIEPTDEVPKPDYSQEKPLTNLDKLAAGTYHYIITAEGYESAEGDVKITDADIKLNLELKQVQTRGDKSHTHTLEAHPATGATCTTEGNTAYWSCSGCGKFFSDANGETEINANSWVLPIDANAHDWNEVEYQLTDAQDNIYQYCTATRTCKREGCNGTETETVAPTYVTTTSPTCTADGVRTYTATFTNTAFGTKTLTDVIPATGHNMTEHAAVEPQVGVAGNIAYWYCDRCNKNFADAQGNTELTAGQEVIPGYPAPVVDPNATNLTVADPAFTTEKAYEYSFANDTATAAALYAYGATWSCDYYISFSNVVGTGSVALAGQYGEYPTTVIEVPAVAGQEVALLANLLPANGGVTLAEVAALSPFTCGVKNITANATMTVTLKMSKEGHDPVTLNSQVYILSYTPAVQVDTNTATQLTATIPAACVDTTNGFEVTGATATVVFDAAAASELAGKNLTLTVEKDNASTNAKTIYNLSLTDVGTNNNVFTDANAGATATVTVAVPFAVGKLVKVEHKDGETLIGTYWATVDANGKITVALPRFSTVEITDPNAVAKIGTTGYTSLQEAIDAAVDGDTVTLLQNVTLSAAQTITGESNQYGAVIVDKSITVDGANHTITSNFARGIGVKGTSSNVTVEFKNLTVLNSQAGAICIITRGGINKLTLDNVTLNTQGCPSGYNQPLTIGGTQNTAATVEIKNNSLIQTNDNATKYYAIIVWNPVNMSITGSTVKGWACVYMKEGSAGSVVTINNSTLVSQGLSGSSNHFAALVTEDDNITMTVTNSTVNVTAAANTYQGIGLPNFNDDVEIELGSGNDVSMTGDTAIIGFNMEMGDVAVSGGSFNKEVDAVYCAEGYIPAEQDPSTGKYTVQQGYKVFFDEDADGEADSFDYAAVGGSINEPAEPTKADSIFGGWHDENDDPVTFPYAPTADVTFTAQWTAAVASINGTLYASLADAIAALPTENKAAPAEATTITLLADTNGGYDFGNSSGTKAVNAILDLNGHTLTLGPAIGSQNTETNGLRVLAYSKLEIKNGTVTNSDVSNASGKKVIFLLVNYSDMTLTNVTVTPVAQAELAINNRGNLTLAGTTKVNNPTSLTGYTGWPSTPIAITNDPYNYYYTNTNASLNVASADVEVGNVMAELYGNSQNAGTVAFNISAGTFDTLYEDGSEAIDVAGNISGGTFDTQLPLEYCADGMIPTAVNPTTGKYTVETGTAVACIVPTTGDTTYYTSLADAIAAVPTDGTATTITMIADYSFTAENGATIAATQNVVLELNGKEIHATLTNAGATALITNNGTLTIQDSSDPSTGKMYCEATNPSSGYGYASNLITNCGTLTVTGGYLENHTLYASYVIDNNSTSRNVTATINGGHLYNFYTDAIRMFLNSTTNLNKVVITGGVIDSDKPSGRVIVMHLPSSQDVPSQGELDIRGGEIKGTVNAWSAANAGGVEDRFGDNQYENVSINISGGYIEKLDFNSMANTEKRLESLVITGGQYANDPSAYLSPEYLASNTQSGTYTYTIGGPYVAKIDTTYYATLAEAFAAAQDDDTITLLADVALTDRLFVNAGATPAYAGSNNRYATTSENKSLTLNLNGHNITSTSNIALAGGTLNITGSGTISTSASGLAPIEVRGTGDLTSKRTLTIGANVTLDSDSRAYGLNVFGSNDEQKNIIDVTVHGTVHGTLFVLGNLKNTANEINIVVDGKIAAPNAQGDEKPNPGIALNGYADVTVSAGADISGDSGIEVRAGSLTVNGGTIASTAATYSVVSNGSGCTTKGAAIAVAQHTTKLITEVEVSGSATLTGTKPLSVADPENNSLEGVEVAVPAAVAADSGTVIPEGYMWIEDTTTHISTLAQAVASITKNNVTTGYTSLADAFAAVPTDGTATTITMIGDVSAEVGTQPLYTIPAGRNVVLDLNGHQIVATCASGTGIEMILNKGTLTIKDSTDGSRNGSGSGKIIFSPDPVWVYSQADPSGYRSNLIGNIGTLNIESGYLENTGNGSAAYVIDTNYYNSTVTTNISGGKLKAAKTAVRICTYSETADNVLNVTGGKFEAGLGLFIQSGSSNLAGKATVTLNGCDMSDTDSSIYLMSYYAKSGENITLNVTSGTFGGDIEAWGNTTGGPTININGGTFNDDVIVNYADEVKIEGGAFNSTGNYGSAYIVYTDKITITETENSVPTFADTVCLYPKSTANANWEISGGEFTDVTDWSTVTGFITGGTFVGAAPDEEYIAPNKAASLYDPQTQTYVIADAVARIGDIGYLTLTDAINAAVTQSKTSGEQVTVALLKNASGVGLALFNEATTQNDIEYPAAGGANVKIDFGGFTYTVETPVGSSSTRNQALHFEAGNTVTLYNGTINMTDDSTKLAAFDMIMQNYCTLTIAGMDIDGTGITVKQYDDPKYQAYPGWYQTDKPQFNYNTAGSSVIRNSTITVTGDVGIDDAAALTIEDDAVINANKIVTKGTDGRYASANATVNVENGAKFKLADSTGAAAFDALLAANGQSLGTPVNGVYTVEAVKAFAAYDSNGDLVGAYTTLDAAIDAGGNGCTVKLVADVYKQQQINSQVTPVTFDLNGHWINVDGGAGLNFSMGYYWNGDHVFTIQDSQGTGGINITPQYPGNACISDNVGRTIIVESGTFTSTGKAVYCTASNATMTINGGTFNGDIYVHDTGNGHGDLSITDGTINGTLTAIDNAEIAVSGGTFSEAVPEAYCANGYMPKDNNNGTYGVTPCWTVTFNLNGGNISGDTANVEVKVAKNTAIPAADKPADPTKVGSTFVDWFVDDVTFQEAYDFTAPVNSNITLYANWVADAAFTFGASLNLKDCIDINIYVYNVPADADQNGYYVQYSTDGGTDYTNASFTDENRVKAGVYKFTVAQFNANEMTNKVDFNVKQNDTVVGRVNNGNGFSIQDYCDLQTDSNVKALCNSLMAYGYYAERRFGTTGTAVGVNKADYNVAISAISNVTDETLENYTASVIRNGNVTGVGASLSLKNRTELNFYFFGVTSVDATVTVGGKQLSYVTCECTTLDSQKCRVTVKGLYMVDLASEIVLTDNLSGTEVTYSPMAYAKMAVQNTTQDADVCKAMYNFCMAAKAHFNVD